MKRPSRSFAAFLVGLALAGTALLPLPFVAVLAFPGMLLTPLIGPLVVGWSAEAVAVAMIIVISLGTLIGWSLAAYYVLHLVDMWRDAA